jgi:hypothetical protein
MAARLVGEIAKRLSLPNADLLPVGSRRSVWTGKTKRKEIARDQMRILGTCPLIYITIYYRIGSVSSLWGK